MTTTYRIRSGDTLSGIARLHGTTVEALVRENKLRDQSRIYVGRTLLIPDSATRPPPAEAPRPEAPPPVPVPQPAPRAEPPSSHELGSLSRRFEAKNPGTISHNPGDAGGASYGAYQFATSRGSVHEFVRGLKSTYPDFFAALDGKEPGSPEFDAAWKQLYAREPERFFRAQHDSITRTHYQAARQLISKALPTLDLRHRSQTLLDVIFSTAVQHGPGGARKVFETALKGQDLGTMAEEILIRAIYTERGRVDEKGNLYYFRNNDQRTQRGVAARFVKEQQLALEMLTRERTPSRTPPVTPLEEELKQSLPSEHEPAPYTPAPPASSAPARPTPPPVTVDPRKDPLNAASYSPVDPNDSGQVATAPKPSVHAEVPFLSQFIGGQGFKEGGTSCFLACKEMARRAGSLVLGPERRIQFIISEDEAGRVKVDPREAAVGRDYLDQQLALGRPVVVGITHQTERKYNADLITDHFVVVTGRDMDAQGRTFYTFHDPATSRSDRGSDINPNNRFRVDERTGGLYRDGRRAVGFVVERRFDVSMVRRNA